MTTQRFYAAASYGHTPEYSEYLRARSDVRSGAGGVSSRRVLLQGESVEIADVLA